MRSQYIRGDTTTIVNNVPFTVTYADVHIYYDQLLYGGSEQKSLKLL